LFDFPLKYTNESDTSVSATSESQPTQIHVKGEAKEKKAKYHAAALNFRLLTVHSALDIRPPSNKKIMKRKFLAVAYGLNKREQILLQS